MIGPKTTRLTQRRFVQAAASAAAAVGGARGLPAVGAAEGASRGPVGEIESIEH
jgi:hypothetical protein